jgi:parvulin-like peptidyl-prolyl isomerase
MAFYMKALFAIAPLFFSLFAQAPPPSKPEVKSDTVVATSAGKKITAGDIEQLLESLPTGMRQNYARDPKGFLSQWFLLVRLTQEAEARKLQEQAPYKQGIEIARMQVLYQAVIEEVSKSIQPMPEDQKKFYEEKKDDFTLASLKIIYVPFVTSPAGSKSLSESEALAKCERLVKGLRAGADFVKYVQEHSEDPVSKEKAGDFGPIKRADKLPDAIKQAVFQLKPGEISEPVRQPNGYYILKLISLGHQPYDEVKDAIHTELKNRKLREWIESNAKAVELKVERTDYFESLR